MCLDCSKTHSQQFNLQKIVEKKVFVVNCDDGEAFVVESHNGGW